MLPSLAAHPTELLPPSSDCRTLRLIRRSSVAPQRVRERQYGFYEREGGESRSLGSIAVDTDSWWSATLSMPRGEPARDGDTLFLRFARHGALPVGYRGETELELALPASEVDAIVALLTGVVKQAHEDGTLPAFVS
jgi:hypothetical protein